MALRREPTDLPGVEIVVPDTFSDARGWFRELFHAGRYANAKLAITFVQLNQSRSVPGALRGLHYQLRQPQDKLVTVARGEIFDVAVDLRRGSPTFGRWTACVLSDANGRQMFIPAGFAHGFCVLGNAEADVVYLCSRLYAPQDNRGVIWNDPDLAIDWPVSAPVLSQRDAVLPRLADIPADQLPPSAGA